MPKGRYHRKLSPRPRCRYCHSRKVVSQGISWYCKNCKKAFVKNPKKRGKPLSPMVKGIPRPKCSICKSPARSMGEAWYCPKDGKWWSKSGKKRVKIPSPPCIKCGSTHVTSQGSSWRCRACGKTWKKRYKGRKRANDPNHPCPNCKSTHVTPKSRYVRYEPPYKRKSGSTIIVKYKCLDCKRFWTMPADKQEL
jgi:uncharacterized Zn ribbon protein